MDSYKYIVDNVNIPYTAVFSRDYLDAAVQAFKERYINKCYSNMFITDVISVKSHTPILFHEGLHPHVSMNVLVSGKVYNNLSVIKATDVTIDNKSIKYAGDNIIATYNEEFSDQGRLDQKYKEVGTFVSIELPSYKYEHDKVLATARIVMDPIKLDDVRILITADKRGVNVTDRDDESYIKNSTKVLIDYYNSLDRPKDITKYMKKYYKYVVEPKSKKVDIEGNLYDKILSIDFDTLEIREIDVDEYDLEMNGNDAILSLQEKIMTLISNVKEFSK